MKTSTYAEQLNSLLQEKANRLADSHAGATVAANLAYEASFWIQAGESFYEVRMGVHTYSPFRDLRCRTIEGKCYEIELPKVAKRKDYQSLSETIQSIILIAGQNAILDTLVVKAPSLLETSDELYQATKNAFHEALPNSQTAGAHGDSLPDPLTLRDSLLRERLMAALSKGINYWNDRSRLEREFLKWEHTDLSGMTLTNIVLTCLDFGHSRFEKSNLSEANLSTIRLDQASLTDANLSKADLTAASLIHTQFLRTNLSQANLERVQAERADFTGANLTGAKLSKAQLQNCIFAEADLSKAKLGLADIRGANFTEATVQGTYFKSALYDESTKFPPSFDKVPQLVWKGIGPDPYKLAQRNASLPDEPVDSLTDFVNRLKQDFDQPRMQKALAMLKKEKFQLYSQVSKGSMLVGVVKSQTDRDLVYACQLKADGTFSCCTQNMAACGGLRGALCKHLLVLALGLVQCQEIDPCECLKWILFSRMEEKPQLDRDRMTDVFIRYKSAEVGEIDWRPSETIPEDYYAF